MLKPIFSSLTVLAIVATQVAQPATAESAPVVATARSPHSAWNTLLGKYVQVSEDGINRFDYAALKANTADRTALDTYIASFAGADMESLPLAEQYVTWVNIYNAVTIAYIVDKYPTRSIRSGYVIGPWKRVYATVDGQKFSLNDIEHKVLRKQWNEPRIHYAVNCAALGCPNLKPSAWEAATLEVDLNQAARDYINHPRGVTIRRDGKLRVSTIYKWFKVDFGTSEANIIAHLRQYADPDLLAQIDANPDIKNYEYDWSLNDTE